MVIQATKVLIWELVREIIYFPFWWYTQGLKRHILYIFRGFQNLNRSLSISLMLKSMFKPMFGQYDRQGRIISFFMRLILLFTRMLVFIFFGLGYVLLFFGWLLLPVLAVWMFMRNFTSLWSN